MPFKSDANQAEIVHEFRKRGAVVDITSRVGNGFPDIVVNYRGLFALIEIKTPKGRLRRVQEEWFEKHEGLCFVVRDVEDVEDVLSIMETIAETPRAKEVL